MGHTRPVRIASARICRDPRAHAELGALAVDLNGQLSRQCYETARRNRSTAIATSAWTCAVPTASPGMAIP